MTNAVVNSLKKVQVGIVTEKRTQECFKVIVSVKVYRRRPCASSKFR